MLWLNLCASIFLPLFYEEVDSKMVFVIKRNVIRKLQQRTVKRTNFVEPGYNYLTCHNDFPIPGRVAQSVTCLATDACLTADPGVASSIPVRSHTFVEIDHEIISTVIGE